MSNITELKELIKKLSEDNFKKLIKNYIKSRYNAKEVVITDGPYDGGIDLKIFINDEPIKKNIQITVQKNDIERKLEDDLIKAKKNINKHSYQKEMQFYWSQSFTPKKIEELVTYAETNYNISLRILDCNVLAELSDSYKIITDTIYGIYNFPEKDLILKIDKNKKILYDLLSEGKDTGDIKEQFIFSYLLSYLYENDNKKAKEIYNDLKEIFEKYNIDFIRHRLNKLKLNGDVNYDKENQNYSLSDKTKDKINDIIRQSLALEKLLKDDIESLLNEYNINEKADEIVKLLLKAYKENYEIDIKELSESSSSYENSLRKIYNEIINYFLRKKNEKKDSQILTKKLLEICNSSDYLNKIAVSTLFTNLFKSEELEKYINKKKHNLYLDTQILLKLICVLYRDIDIDDLSFKAIKDFYKNFKNNKNRIFIKTTLDYIDETAYHIEEAIKLQRFLKLPFINELGPSNNIFYNYLLKLRSHTKNDTIELSEILNEITNSELCFSELDFHNKLFIKLKEIFEYLEFEIISHSHYDNFSKVRIEYEKELAYTDKFRPPKTIDRDVRTILFLADKENHFDNELEIFIEPYLITWDTVFYPVRKNIVSNLKEISYWYIYSPSKYFDRFSVSNFKLNSKPISYNIAALAESNYNKYSKSTFLDVMNSLFNQEDLGELSLVHKLIELKNKSTPSLEYEKPLDIDIEEQYSPLTDILIGVRNYFCMSTAKYKLDDLSLLFENPKFGNEIIELFKRNIDFITEYKKLDDKIYEEFNVLIKKNE